MNPNPDAPVQQPSWFSRNWKWLIPVGCLIPLLCCGSFAAVTYFGVTTLIKSSTPFQQAITLAEANPEVQAALGTPLSAGLAATGKINTNNGVGTCDFNVSISGPKGSGSLHVVGASPGNDAWVLSVVEVSTGGKTIEVGTPEQDLPSLPDEDDAPSEPADPE